MSLKDPIASDTPIVPYFPGSDPLPTRGIVTQNVVVLRGTPNSSSEIVSQAILGDPVDWLAEEGDYVRVRMADAYEGWIWRGSLLPVNGPQSDPTGVPLPETTCYVQSDYAPFHLEAGRSDTLLTRLVCGTRLRTVAPKDGPLVEIEANENDETLVMLPSGWQQNDENAFLRGYVPTATLAPLVDGRYPGIFDGKTACALALRFRGIPYLWGGTTPFGFDCSGLMQRVYALLNVTIPRDAYQQAESPLGTRLDTDAPTQAGDLVFFGGYSDPRKRGITHVGMALDTERFVHAVGKQGVTVSEFTDPYYRTQYLYRGAWRLTGATSSAER